MPACRRASRTSWRRTSTACGPTGRPTSPTARRGRCAPSPMPTARGTAARPTASPTSTRTRRRRSSSTSGRRSSPTWNGCSASRRWPPSRCISSSAASSPCIATRCSCRPAQRATSSPPGWRSKTSARRAARWSTSPAPIACPITSFPPATTVSIRAASATSTPRRWRISTRNRCGGTA